MEEVKKRQKTDSDNYKFKKKLLYLFDDIDLDNCSYKDLEEIFESIKSLYTKECEAIFNNEFVKFFYQLIKRSNDCYYDKVFVPIAEKRIYDETGRESKFGGNLPFFIEGDKWPMYKSKNGTMLPFDFVCQYSDPLKRKNPTLIQVFLPLSDSNAMSCNGNVPVFFRKIDFSKENMKKQIHITRPITSDSFKPLKSFLIESFERTEPEIKEFEYIMKKFKFPSLEDNAKLWTELYFEYNRVSSNKLIKIGGTRFHCQKIDLIEEENILQLTNTSYFQYFFGDNGFGHINYVSPGNYVFTWDNFENKN